MGYDTLSANDMPPGDPREDSKLLMIARDEDRILLTRDGELARRDQIQALFLNGERLEDQIRQLICASLIIPELRLTRCSVCNNPLIPITEDDFGRLKRKIPDFGTTQEPVLWCRQCTRGPVTIKFPEPELREKPELSAPDGVTISIGSGFFSSFSGTSASAPHIAGLASLLWEAYPAMKEGEIREALINATADSTWTWDPSIGYGMPDARRLILLVQAAEGDLSVLIPQVNYPLTFAPREMEPAETVVLYPGWNMISIPFPLESGSDTGMMFSAVNTTSHSIWRYAGDNSHWTVVRDNDTLSHMDVIWVNSANRTELSMNYDDSRQNMTARRLTTGWNPLGLPGRSTLTACDLLAPLGNTWAYILVFDPRLQQFRPAIINGGIGAYSDERLLYPTEGFWIYMNAPGLIIP
jgi:hypothetical protein